MADLFSVATDVQRLIECNSFTPLSATTVATKWSRNSKKILHSHNLTLLEALKCHADMVAVWLHEGCTMLSFPGSPWLGPSTSPPAVHGPRGPKLESETTQIPEGLHRGKASEMMEQLTELPLMQRSLREIAECLLAASARTRLASEIGNLLSAETRAFLKSVKLRTAQLLRCFPDDFHVEDLGAASTVTYKRDAVKAKYVPSQTTSKIDITRRARLLKLSADVTMQNSAVGSISCDDLEAQLQHGILLVDCRSDEERAVSILPGAVPALRITWADLESWRLIVAYCCIGCRSSTWCSSIVERAPGDMASRCVFLMGGVGAWSHHGGEFEDVEMQRPVKKVHCWTLALAPFFPSKGYDVICPSYDHEQSARPDDSLVRASLARLDRLRNLAFEVQLRYCPTVLCIEAEDLLRCLSSKEAEFVFIDCRTEDESKVSTIARMNFPVLTREQFLKNFTELVRMPCIFIAYCTMGGRSGMFCEELSRKQASGELQLPASVQQLQIRSILGGIAAWLHAGGGLVDFDGRPTRRVHPWIVPFMDLFPVQGLQLICNELQATTPNDAKPFIHCCSSEGQDFPQASCTGVPQKIVRAAKELVRLTAAQLPSSAWFVIQSPVPNGVTGTVIPVQ